MSVTRLPDAPVAYDQRWAQRLISATESGIGATMTPRLPKYTVSNYTPARTLDMATATAEDIGNVLCTLIADLQAGGV